MADKVDPKVEKSAEKAYAAASESVPVDSAKTAASTLVDVAPVEFPAKAKRAPKPLPLAAIPPVAAPIAIEAPALPKIRKSVAKPVATANAPAAKVSIKTAATKAVPAKEKAVEAKPVRFSKPADIADSSAPNFSTPKLSAPKEKLMEKTTEFVEGFQNSATEAQAKAKSVLAKGGAILSEYADFAKGNVAAVVESGKILAAGVQTAGSTAITDGKTAIETMTADAKQLAAAKSPTDFFKLQSDIMSRNFDSAIAKGTKNSEAAMKLAGAMIAPISDRFTLAMAKVKAAV
jgi:hypothetical protein